MMKCPNCINGTEFITERTPDGNTECVSCHYTGKTIEFQDEAASSLNNGGSTDYYQLKPEWKDCLDIVEARNMNYSQGNILKSAFTFNIGRHDGTNYERELNKIIFFAEREKKRISDAKQ